MSASQRTATIEDIQNALEKVRRIDNKEEAKRIIAEQLQDFTPESIEKAWADLDLIDRARGARLYDVIETLGYKSKLYPLTVFAAMIKHPVKFFEILCLAVRLMFKGGSKGVFWKAVKSLGNIGKKELG